jgi:hypothetical protein
VVERFVLMVIRRSAFFAVFLAATLSLTHTTSRAQTFKLDLNRYHSIQTSAPWDTLRTPIDRIYLGPYHAVPNFLTSDFSRERVIVEYPPHGNYRITFRVPPTVPFRSEEVREGSFIVMSARPVDDPQIGLSVATIDELAAARFDETRQNVWAVSTKQALASQDALTEEKKGLLNISIPVSLPSSVERIIGQGEKTNIDISGRESITFAGETRRVNPFYGVEGQQKQSLFPSLDMKQELDVRVQGQIGEKINIQVDHTSSGGLDAQSRIRLNYQGFEDDVVKLIELGNTSLSLPGSQLVSFSAASKGLFGVKALAQAGPLDITAIASKEEGEVSRASFSPSGGQIGQREERRIPDTGFVKNKFFFLDDPFRSGGGKFSPPKVGQIDLYRSIRPTEPGTYGKAFVDSSGAGDGIGLGTAFEEAKFEALEQGTDYFYVMNATEPTQVLGIELAQALSEGQILAAAYVNSDGEIIGDFDPPAFSVDPDAPLLFELIWPASPLPNGPYGYTWSFMMRHIYDLGLSDIDRSSLVIEIEDKGSRSDAQSNRTTPEGNDVPWIRIFGLDITDVRGTGAPDGKVDLLDSVINLTEGLLTFPVLTPFTPPPDLVTDWTDTTFSFTGAYENLPNPSLYTVSPNNISDFQNKFDILVQAQSTTRTFRINAFNITEGSEVIKLDGQTLQRNQDYKIDYETGEIELIGDVPLTATSNITIDYEYKPLFGTGSSTLLGFTSIWTLSKNSRLGTTWLYQSKASSTNKPRLGEEPTKAVIGGFDANLQYEPDFLTSLVNLLPLVETDARSSVGFNGGFAVSFPDPNTKGEAYIDDMEGVEDSDVFSVTRRSWYPASPPLDLSDTNLLPLPADKRTKIYWYNIEPDRGVHRRDLNPDLDERESTLVPSLDIEFDAIPEDSTEWAGVMTGFRGGLDLAQAQFIELWVNDFQPASANRKGVLHLDLGYIDEDFYKPDENEHNLEDWNKDGFIIGGELGEDTGLDGVFTPKEGDDPDDDYNSQRIEADGNRFTRINGTEGNGLSDDEDLDGTTQMEERNAYFTFEVDLSDSAVTDIRRDFPSFKDFTDSLDTWRFYRIDLGQYQQLGDPLIEQIKHARIWLTDIGNAVNSRRSRIQIAELKVVGNRWEKDGIRSPSDGLIVLPDTLNARFALGVISNKTDPAKYRSPVSPNVQNEISEKEQSLLLKYDDIEPQTAVRILKRFAGSGLDFFIYNDLNFFVHTDKLDSELEYFFRIAFDSLAYYEIQVPLTPDYFGGDNWCRVAIDMDDLTGLKLLEVDSTGVATGTATDMADPAKTYTVRVKGLPTIFNVRYLYAGLHNTSNDRRVSGELWINDIYLGNRSKDVDTAERLTGSLNMGNIINLSGSWTRTGPEYVSFGQKRGSGTDSRSVSLNAKTNVEHFVPLFGFSVPVTGSFGRNTNLPKFVPNSDTEIGGTAVQDSLKTQATTRSIALSLSRTNSQNPILKYTVDKLKLSYSLSQAQSKNPSAADSTTSMSGTLDYSISFAGKHRVRLFKGFGIRYWPNSINYRLSASKSEGRHYRNVGTGFKADPYTWTAGLSNFGSLTYVPVPSLNMSFRIQNQQDLNLPNSWLGLEVGTEVNMSHGLQASYKPPPVWLIRVFSPDLSYNSGYNEDASPNIQTAGDPPGVRNVSASRDVSVKVGFDVGRYLGKAFGAVGLMEEPGGGADAKRQPGAAARDEPGVRPAGDQRAGTKPAEARADTTAAPDSVEAGGKPKVDALTAVRKVTGVFGNIRKINASIQQKQSTRYSRIPERPSILYQLGLESASGVSTSDSTYDTPEQISQDLRVAMDSGVQLTRNIDVAARFARSTGSTEFRGSETESKQMQWPDLSVSWKELEKIGPFRGLFATSSATMSYNRSKNQSGRDGAIQTTRVASNFTPSIVFQWKNDIRSTVGVQYQTDKTETRGAVTENSNLAVNLDLKYTFTPGKAISIPLPFLRNKTLKSRLDTSVSTGYSRTGGRKSSGEAGRFIPVPGTSVIRFSPRVAYNFTQALNGAFFIDFSRTYAEQTDQTTTIVRIGLTATFTF